LIRLSSSGLEGRANSTARESMALRIPRFARIGAGAAIVLATSMLGYSAYCSRTARWNDKNCAFCTGNLATISLLLHRYHEKFGHLPPAYLTDAHGRPAHSWRVLVLESAGEPLESLYRQYRLEEPWNGPNNMRLSAMIPQCYSCPNHAREAEAGLTSYLAITGPSTSFPNAGTVSFSEITDGLSNTLQVCEVADAKINWMAPVDLALADLGSVASARPDSFHPSSRDRCGIGLLFGDGKVRRIPPETPTETLRTAATISDREYGDFR
jgi:hypothetical protein